MEFNSGFKGLKMYTFCPQNSFVCFVGVAEHTTIISVCSINWLVFITETESVYCAVRAEYLKPWLRVLIAGLSPPQRGFDARSVHVRFVVDEGGTGTGFSPEYFDIILSVSPHAYAILISIYVLHLPEGPTGEAWEPSKKQCSFGNGGAWDRIILALFFFCSLQSVTRCFEWYVFKILMMSVFAVLWLIRSRGHCCRKLPDVGPVAVR